MRLSACVVVAVVLPQIANAGDVFIGDWNGLVPHSMEILSEDRLKICREDLQLQCQFPVPYSRDGNTIVVEKFTDGLRWTYTPRSDGGYDATYDRWNGKDGYDTLATARLTPR
ncbi:MAG: hypothetical protein AAF557_07185 [Pseudomonadota bacterium]